MKTAKINILLATTMLMLFSCAIVGEGAVLDTNKNATDPANPGSDSEDTKKLLYAPNEIIIKVRSTASAIKESVHQSEDLIIRGAVIRDIPELPDKVKNLVKDDTALEPVFKDLHRQMRAQRKTEEEINRETFAKISKTRRTAAKYPTNYNLSNVYILRGVETDNRTIEEICQDIKDDPNIEYAQPNYTYQADMVPNDEYYPTYGTWGQNYDDLWGLKPERLNGAGAWDFSEGEGVVAAVIDTGVDYSHRDLGGSGIFGVVQNRLTSDLHKYGAPSLALHGDRIVWAESGSFGQDYISFMLDFSTGERFRIFINDVVDMDTEKAVLVHDGYNVYVYDLSVDSDGDGIPNYRDSDWPVPDPAEFRITTDATPCFGFSSVHMYGDKIVWTATRYDTRNNQIYLYDLGIDSDGDGIPNYRDSDRPIPDPAEIQITRFSSIYGVLSGKSGSCLYEDKIVWSDLRNNTLGSPSSNNAEIYLYNLSIDSDGDGIPNYRDADRPDPDPAEIRITNHSLTDETPAIYGDKIVFKRKDYHSIVPTELRLYDLLTGQDVKIAQYGPGGVGGTDDPYTFYPDIYGNKIVWTGRGRHLWVYDLSVDSDGDGIPNYLDADRPNPDPAAIQVIQDRFNKYYPRIYGERVGYNSKLRLNSDPNRHTAFYIDLSTYAPHQFPTSKVIGGYDFVNGDNDPMDDNGHGTHTAGTIAAIGNNELGIIGVAPEAKIFAVKGLDSSGSGSTSVLSQCIRYAADNGVGVISNSWGPSARLPEPYTNPTIEAAIDYAYGLNCVVVFSAGNNNDDVAYYSPQNYPKVITVASVDHDDIKSDFSNWGNKIDVTAPGGESGFVGPGGTIDVSKASILSLRAQSSDPYMGANAYNYGDLFFPTIGNDSSEYYRSLGTSMACPHVSGLAALIISLRPDLTNEQVKETIKNTADDLGDIGFDIYYGSGRINAYEAVRNLVHPPTLVPIGDKLVDENSLIEFTVVATDTDNEVLNFVHPVASELPQGAQFNIAVNEPGHIEGIFLWTPSYTQSGDYFIPFEISDGRFYVSELVNIHVNNVNRAPQWSPIGNKKAVVGRLLQFNVNASDPDNNPLTLTAALANGDPLSSIGAFFVDHHDGTGTFSWTPTAAHLGSHMINFVASDGNLKAAQMITIWVHRDITTDNH